ncbi:MAG: GYF domain-containing protein [Bdellovibrionales bacterium]
MLRNEDVSGPFSTEEVKNLATQGEFQDRDLIWGRMQVDWKPLGWWMVELPNLLAKTKEVRDPRLWHYAVGGSSFGPFSREDLVVKLKETNLNQEVLIWTKGMKAWAPIYEFNDILDSVGLNKRQYPRAEIEGKVSIKVGQQSLDGNLLVISEGGFGADQLSGLTAGQVVTIEINSDSFYDPIHAKAEVRYVTENGYVGFRFQNINMEARGAIIQYVRSSGRTFVRAA